jgi:hypothetical protein
MCQRVAPTDGVTRRASDPISANVLRELEAPSHHPATRRSSARPRIRRVDRRWQPVVSWRLERG